MKMQEDGFKSNYKKVDDDSSLPSTEIPFIDMSEKEESLAALRKRTKITLVIMSAVYSIALPFSIMPAMFSIMLGTNTRTETYIAILSLLTLPGVLLFSIIVPWVLYSFKIHKTSLAVLFLPFINGILILFYVVFH